MGRFLIITSVLLTVSPAIALGESPLDARADDVGPLPEDLCELGYLHIEAHRFTDAKRVFHKLRQSKDEAAEAALGLAMVDIVEGKHNKAKNACKKLVRQYKTKAAGRVCGGWLWLHDKRASRAEEEFLRAIELGDIRRGKTGMGDAYRQKADFAEALEAYNVAIEAGAGSRAHVGRALALESMGDRSGALAALEKAVLTEPASCLAHYHYGRLLPPGDKAAEHLSLALAIREDHTDALVAMGNHHVTLGQFDDAVRAFESAAEADAAGVEVYLGLGRAWLGAGRDDHALEVLTKALGLVPHHTDTLLLVAEIQARQGDTSGASESLKSARASSPGDVEVYYHSGRFYFQVERFTTARLYLRKALAMAPGMSRAHFLLAKIACDRQLYKDGQTSIDKALGGDLEGVNRETIEAFRSSCRSE